MTTNKYLLKIASTSENKSKSSFGPTHQIVGGLAGGMAAEVAAGVIQRPVYNSVIKSIHSTGKSDLGTIKKMIRDNKLDVTFNHRDHYQHKHVTDHLGTRLHFNERHNSSDPGFWKDSNASKKGLIMGVKKGKGTVNKDIIMHELGHAKDFKTNHGLKHGSVIASHLAGRLAPFALLNKHTEDYAAPIAATGGLITLRHEAAANYHAYHGIKAHKGGAAAKAFAKRILPAQMGSYAIGGLAPAVGYHYVAKALKHYRNKANQD